MIPFCLGKPPAPVGERHCPARVITITRSAPPWNIPAERGAAIRNKVADKQHIDYDTLRVLGPLEADRWKCGDPACPRA